MIQRHVTPFAKAALRRAALVAPAIAAVAAIAVASTALYGQSNLSSQGLGYPPGQLSTRVVGTAGALAEVDPISQVNPSALSLVGGTILFFQIEPEFRRVSAGTATDRTTTSRYPLFAAAIPMGSRWAAGLSSATLLDRTWVTSTRDDIVIDGATVGSTINNGSDGSINDLRLALAFTPVPWLHLGLGGHLMSGSDRVYVGRTFDSPAFGSFADTSIIGFDGGAVSAGVLAVAPRVAMAAASFRKGGTLHADRSDTSLGSARVPDRLGFSLAYIGIAGTQIAARTSYEKWSALDGLRRGNARAVNAWDTSVGADIAGPRFAGRTLMLRAGGRWRTLPYEATPGHKVSERSVSIGLGTVFAGGRVLSDLALTRAQRDASISVNERAWTLSIGLGVRP